MLNDSRTALPDTFSRAFSFIFCVRLSGHNKIIGSPYKNEESGISKLRWESTKMKKSQKQFAFLFEFLNLFRNFCHLGAVDHFMFILIVDPRMLTKIIFHINLGFFVLIGA